MPKKPEIIEPIDTDFNEVVRTVARGSRPTHKYNEINGLQSKVSCLGPAIQQVLFQVENAGMHVCLEKFGQ